VYFQGKPKSPYSERSCRRRKVNPLTPIGGASSILTQTASTCLSFRNQSEQYPLKLPLSPGRLWLTFGSSRPPTANSKLWNGRFVRLGPGSRFPILSCSLAVASGILRMEEATFQGSIRLQRQLNGVGAIGVGSTTFCLESRKLYRRTRFVRCSSRMDLLSI